MEDRMDVPYGTGNGRPLCLDIYPPDAGRSLRTAVLMFHGGGWRRGDRKMMAPHARLLREDGFTALAIEYRLLGESAWPGAIHDVKAAIRWVRANAADLAIDADRIVLEGFSAGAHLSLLAAGTPDNPAFEGDGGTPGVSTAVAAVAVFYPPTVFYTGETRASGAVPATALLGDDPDPDVAHTASPTSHVTASFPPCFMLHGATDQVVPASASFVMYEALRAAGASPDLHIFSRLGHGFGNIAAFREVAAREVSLFFRRTVSDTEGIAAQIEAQRALMRPAMAATEGGTSG